MIPEMHPNGRRSVHLRCHAYDRSAALIMSDLCYVILYHDGFGEPHYDLMFETSPGSDLLTWRSDSWPIEPHTTLTPIAVHRRAYLDYEGEVSGGRGTVRRAHSGTFQLQQNDDDAFAGVFETGKTFRLSKHH